VLGTAHAKKFLNGRRAMSSVLSRNETLRKKFTEKFGDRYRTVRDHYLPRKKSVVFQDVSSYVPGWLRLLKLLRLKRNKPVPLTAGVLIIGSLFWDSERGRPAWREARLDMASAQSATAPIRYGRLSGKGRGYTYTMVFSRLAAIWSCESGSMQSANCAAAGGIADSWGCVALLCNPDRELPEDLLKAWTDHVGREPNYGKVTQTKEEGRLIDENGRLLIAWPTWADTGEPVQFDLLLVTANDPEISTARPNSSWCCSGNHPRLRLHGRERRP
jgi:hypothetical protein